MMAAAGGDALRGEEGGAGQELGVPGGEAEAAGAWLEGDGGDGLLGEEGAQDEFI